jgi:hypothetical protein
VRVFLTMIVGIMLLGGCAAKPTAGSAQAISAQEDKGRVACLEEPLKKEAYAQRQKSFASCMRARGYHDYISVKQRRTREIHRPTMA